jgi:lysozyme
MILTIGSQGAEVIAWQTFLNANGFNAGTADGIFGNGTSGATKTFQTSRQLPADGIVGNQTIAMATSMGFQPVTSFFPPVGNINVVVDVSHFQNNIDFAAVKQDGILAMIHKATQGTTYTDPTYAQNRDSAKTEGLLWGAYHFGTAQDVPTQVSHFLQVAAALPDTLLVLDWEENGIASQGTMSLDQAKQFVQMVKAQTGKFPVLYGGSLIKNSVGANGDPILSQCPLWLAQYTTSPTLPAGWNHYDLWQYTDGTNGPSPHSINGIGPCDRDVFAGTASTLIDFWKSGLEEALS